jgi:hypothetical protein
MLKRGNFNYRNWALLQIAGLIDVFAQASKPLLLCPSVAVQTSVSKWGKYLCRAAHQYDLEVG